MEHKLQQRMDHDMYGLRPNHRFFQQHPTVNDALANLIASGMLFVVVCVCLINMIKFASGYVTIMFVNFCITISG
jgi:hypothetical protein